MRPSSRRNRHFRRVLSWGEQGLLTPLPSVNRRVGLWGESPRVFGGEIRGPRATPRVRLGPRVISFEPETFPSVRRTRKPLEIQGKNATPQEMFSRGAQSTSGSGNSVTVHSAPRDEHSSNSPGATRARSPPETSRNAGFAKVFCNRIYTLTLSAELILNPSRCTRRTLLETRSLAPRVNRRVGFPRSPPTQPAG